MWVRFGQVETEFIDKYEIHNYPRDHIQLYMAAWGEILREEWVHGFSRTLETIPQNWYLKSELQHGTTKSASMMDGFVMTFRFEDDCLHLDGALNIVKKNIFENEVPII